MKTSTYGKITRWKEGVRCQTYFVFGEGGNQRSNSIIRISAGGKDKKNMNNKPTTTQGEGMHHGVFFFLYFAKS